MGILLKRIRTRLNGNRFFKTIGLFLFVCLLSNPVVAGVRPWPHESSQLPIDSTLSLGNLSNGFRYALKPHATTPGRISMRFVVSVGSVDEEQHERGLSHFVEHMAFAGTKRYPSGEMDHFFQKLGMDFGGDVTAFTYYDKTVYHLELPNNGPELIRQSIELFRDFADGILFEKDRIDIEREVILRERQVRETPNAKLSEHSMEFANRGSLLVGKLPIGDLSVIEKCGQDDLLEFYRKWYRPDLMSLIIVGDFDLEPMESEISNHFSDMEVPGEPRLERDWGKVSEHKIPKSYFYSMEGMDRYHVEALRAWNDDGKDSWKRREKEFLREFATELFNERCRLEIDEVRNDFASYERFLNIPQINVTISVGGSSWMNGVVWLDRRLRQAYRYGFSEYEVEKLRKSWRRSNRSFVKHYDSLESSEIIDEIVDSLEEGHVYLGAADLYAFKERMLENVSQKQIRDEFREIWDYDKIKYFIAGEHLDASLDENLGQTLKADRKLKLPEYEVRTRSYLAFDDPENVGTIASEERIEAIENAYSLLFSNNVRLTFMNTDYEEESAHVLVRVGGGMLEFESANPAIHEIGLNAFFRTGFGDYSMEQIYNEIRENLDSFSFSAAEHDAFEFRCSGDEEGVEFFFHMLTEYLKAPDIRESAFASAKLKYRQMRLLEPDGMYEGYRTLQKMLFQGASQFQEPTLEEIDAAGLQEAKDWLVEAFREGFLEVIVVGDFDKDVVSRMLARTLATLPERRSDKSEFDLARKLRMEIPVGDRKIEYGEGKGENAFAVVTWSVNDVDISFRESASLFVFSQILENRFHEEVRQKLGKSYSPSVNYQVYPAYETVRLFRADVDCLREDTDSVLQLVLKITDDILETGMDTEEVARSVIPLQDRIVGAWRDNDFLANIVFSGMYEYDDSIHYALAYKNGLLSELTPEEILASARKYLKKERRLSVAITPSSNNSTTDSAADYGDSSRAGLGY